MKIIGIAGSPRKHKSSHFLLEQCLESIELWGEKNNSPIQVELIDLAPLRFAGCIACDKCKKGPTCSQDDDFQQLIPKLQDPELAGLVISTPVYMGTMTSQAKAFLDRTVLHRRNGFLLRDKIGGVIAVGGSRNGGQELTCQAVHAAMMIHDMIIVGDGGHFGGAAWGNHPEGYTKDETGIETARGLGEKIATIASKQFG